MSFVSLKCPVQGQETQPKALCKTLKHVASQSWYFGPDTFPAGEWLDIPDDTDTTVDEVEPGL